MTYFADPVAPNVSPHDTEIGSTRALGWESINLESHRSGPGYMHLPQGATEHLLILHRSAAQVLRESEGARRICSLNPGSFLLLPASMPVAWTFDRLEVQIITVSPMLLVRVADEMGMDSLGGLRLLDRDQADATVASVWRCLESEWKSGGERGQLYRDTLACLLARHVLRMNGNGRVRRRTRASASVLRAMEYMSDCYASDLSLAQLGDVAKLNPSHLVTVFRKATGLAPHQFLIHLRIDRAKQRLRCSRERDTPLAEMSVQLGFNDQSHFIRHFKRLTGTTPGAWRAAERQRTCNTSRSP
jgi:AraC family transcriptional regulator